MDGNIRAGLWPKQYVMLEDFIEEIKKIKEFNKNYEMTFNRFSALTSKMIIPDGTEKVLFKLEELKRQVEDSRFMTLHRNRIFINFPIDNLFIDNDK